ncbi:hypothetical protein BT63DRAFT_461311 [Microthyrium microscopicum]|uniref:Uncharacterized protein n=1 Tax=Microthyrium microscopicum TaxID=703497 RepID=A0A6A6TY43_9PEZI|nr:hypothetical protein BT63DRAFT_461311 [Microthyrium microscopicum]
MSALDTEKKTKGASVEADGQAELSEAIETLLKTVGDKFQNMSKDILTQSM